MFKKNLWFLNFQKEFLNFSFCICKLAVAFYMINEIQPKIKFQNIVQCPFNAQRKLCRHSTLVMIRLCQSNDFLPFSKKYCHTKNTTFTVLQDIYYWVMFPFDRWCSVIISSFGLPFMKLCEYLAVANYL